MKAFFSAVCAAALAFTVACGQSDAGITTAVKSNLAADDTVKAYQIDVDTENRVVTLTGEVDTAAQREHAVMIARGTDGVTDVIDQLRIDATEATTGVDVDGDVDVDVDDDFERDVREGADAVGDAAKRAAEKAREGARKVGDAVEDVVTDDDPDSDNDGK